MTVFENHLRALRCILFSLGPLLMPWWGAVIEIPQQPCSVGSVNMLLSSTAISGVTKHLRPLLQEEPCSDDLNNIKFYNQLCLWEVARINNLCLKSQQLKSSLSGFFILPCPAISAWSLEFCGQCYIDLMLTSAAVVFRASIVTSLKCSKQHILLNKIPIIF